MSAGPGLHHPLESGFAGGEGVVGKTGQTAQLLFAILVALECQPALFDLAQELLGSAPVRGGLFLRLQFLELLLQRENLLFEFLVLPLQFLEPGLVIGRGPAAAVVLLLGGIRFPFLGFLVFLVHCRTSFRVGCRTIVFRRGDFQDAGVLVRAFAVEKPEPGESDAVEDFVDGLPLELTALVLAQVNAVIALRNDAFAAD